MQIGAEEVFGGADAGLELAPEQADASACGCERGSGACRRGALREQLPAFGRRVEEPQRGAEAVVGDGLAQVVGPLVGPEAQGLGEEGAVDASGREEPSRGEVERRGAGQRAAVGQPPIGCQVPSAGS